MSQNDLIFHVAIDHKLIEKFIKELTIELKKFGSGFNIPSLICPYNQYETCSKEKTPFQLIQHLVDHCNGEVCTMYDRVHFQTLKEFLIFLTKTINEVK